MKVHIINKTKDIAWVGNQFLNALKALCENNMYVDDAKKSNLVLLNSYPSGEEFFYIKINLSEII